jgi:hypothetical protein
MRTGKRPEARPGQRVRILAWFDPVALVTSHRPGVDFLGTVQRVHETAGDATVWISVDGVGGSYAFRPGDLEAIGPASDPASRAPEP